MPPNDLLSSSILSNRSVMILTFSKCVAMNCCVTSKDGADQTLAKAALMNIFLGIGALGQWAEEVHVD
jgi:hypothetical protein